MAVILCNLMFVNLIVYLVTPVITALLFVFQLPDLPYPAGSLVQTKKLEHEPYIRYIALAYWCFHFLRRAAEVVFVHIYRRKMPLSEALGAPLYYWLFAAWIGWSLQKSTFQPVYLEMFIIGTIIFTLGEVGNCYCHVRLRLFRTRQFPLELVSLQTGHVLPHGFLFDWVSCPHYLCEILSWVGYFLVTCTMPVLLFLLATVVTLVIYARKNTKCTYMSSMEKITAQPIPEGEGLSFPYCYDFTTALDNTGCLRFGG